MEIIIICFLGAVLGFAVAYIKYLISKVREVSDDFLIIREMIKGYEVSLQSVYQSETFFGEPILEALVEHTKSLSADLELIVANYDYEGDEEGEVGKIEET